MFAGAQQMLKVDWKQNFVLLAFSVLMVDVLTGATLIFVAAGLLLVFFNIKTTKIIRNVLALGVFASYWITYGKIIDPEVGLNFLTSIIVLKILEKETVRDRYMIFFGLLLLISAGSLFERSLTYVIFFSIAFLILIRDFYSYLEQKWRLKDLGYALLWVLPLTFFLFFFVPRLLNPIPFQQGKASPGEVGYTPDVNISQIESLAGNPDPVFQVLLSKHVSQGDLYWRANTLSYNDGWNWIKMSQDTVEPEILLGAGPSSVEVKQNFRLFSKSDYFFALDFPRVLSHGKEVLGLGSMRTLVQRRWNWVQRYEAISSPKVEIKELTAPNHYLQVALPKNVKREIDEKFSGTNLKDVSLSIRRHFQDEQFSYSLSPGKSANFREFMRNKIGFCSHYASAVAIIMRVKGIPTRLVSGFMGGTYNRFADFYLVSQNDAHVWVEAFSNGHWVRLDPTEWIAPDRVRLGGEAFMESVKQGAFKGSTFFKMPKFMQDLKMWFGQWDFSFYQWLEQMDYHTQDAMFTKFNFKREWLFSIIPMIMVLFMGVYSWYLSNRKVLNEESEYQELWRAFYKKMKKRGIVLSKHSVFESELIIKNASDPAIHKVWKDLIALSFQGCSIPLKDIRKSIQRL
jgi:transglutaminase-like putative cysteine protease